MCDVLRSQALFAYPIFSCQYSVRYQLFTILAQRDRLIVILIPTGIDQGGITLCGDFEKLLEILPSVIQFGKVPHLEFIPLL